MAHRIVITASGGIAGWVVGVFAYVGLLYLFDDGPGLDELPVGALLLGLIAMVGLRLAASWRLSACCRADRDRKAGPTEPAVSLNRWL